MFTFLISFINLITPIYGQSSREILSELRKPVHQLFSHEQHKVAFEKLNVDCRQCHSFGIKSIKKGPLASPVPTGYLAAPKKSCHQCHRSRVNIPVPNRCQLCHKSIGNVAPEDHKFDWHSRHGKAANIQGQSCMECHKQETCSECHIRRDPMKAKVHRGNFRFTHAIEGRAKPSSCIQCHRAHSFCLNCHLGDLK